MVRNDDHETLSNVKLCSVKLHVKMEECDKFEKDFQKNSWRAWDSKNGKFQVCGKYPVTMPELSGITV